LEIFLTNSLAWLDEVEDERNKKVTIICLCVCVFTALFMRRRVNAEAEGYRDIRIAYLL